MKFKIKTSLLALCIIIGALPFTTQAQEISPQVEITGTQAGHNWIQLSVQFQPGLLQGEQFFASCLPKDPANGTEPTTSISSEMNITVYNLESGINYRCEVDIRRSDGSNYFKSEPAFISTITRPKVQIASSQASDTSIVINLTPVTLEPNENYIVTCTPLNQADAVQSHAGKNTEVTITGLKSETYYTCQAAIQYTNATEVITYGEGDAKNIQTERVSGNVRILNYTVYDTMIDMVLANKTLNSNERFFGSCTATIADASNPIQPKAFEVTGQSTHLKINGLSPNTLYSCNAGVLRDNDPNRYDQAPGIRVRTSQYTATKVQVENVTTTGTSSQITIANFSLASGDQFISKCVNLKNSTQERIVYSTSNTLVQNELDLGSQYDCFVGVERKDASGNSSIVHKSPTFTISTIINALPFASYPDPVIEDWSLYRNPFPDTVLSHITGESAAELFRRKVIQGYPSGNFIGSRAVNRAEAAKFLLTTRKGEVSEVQNDGRFSDIPNNEWYTKYVMTAALEGVIDGHPDGTFKPGNQINRAEFLKMISKAFDINENMIYGYNDVSRNAWYARYAGAAEKYDLFPDAKDNLFPSEKMSRYDVSVAIYQFLKNR